MKIRVLVDGKKSKYKNPEERLEYLREYYQTHKEKYNERCRRFYQKHKEQQRERGRKHYHMNRERYLARTKELKIKVLTHYSSDPPKCACPPCGEDYIEFLTIDHIEGGGRKHIKSIGTSMLYRWLVKNNFPEGFQVLCMNCNFSKGKYGYCPHQN